MRRSAARSHIPVRIPAILSSKALAALPDTDLLQTHKPYHRRRIRSPAFPCTAAGLRPRKAGAASCGRRIGANTPLLRWKFDEGDRSGKLPPESGAKTRRKASNVDGVAVPTVSARKLAAGMWHLMFPEVGGGGGGGSSRQGFEPARPHLQVPYVCDPNNIDIHISTRNNFRNLHPVLNPKNGILHKLEHHVALPNSSMERETKWDPRCSKTSDEAYYQFSSNPNALDGQPATAVSAVSALQAELDQARTRIDELEAERQLSKRKMDHLLRKVTDEKASWRSREHEKIRAIIDGTKDDLSRERRNRQRVEFVNSKLVNELAEAKSTTKRFLQDCEKERKARELMEEVCDELAKEIGEDKAEVEALKRECMKIREEAEEERRMLQIAEVWREERVQMKLVDAKVTLEDKYSQLIKLIADLEVFMRARGSNNSDATEMREIELIKETADSIMVHEVKEFSYHPPRASEDIFTVVEELQPREEPCFGYSPASHASKIHTVSPETDVFLEKPTKRYSNGLFDRNGDVEDDSGWETVSHDDGQGSSNSPAGSNPSVNDMRGSNASASGTDWEENDDNGKLNGEIIEVCSVTTRQSMKKTSSISRLWRSSCPNNGEDCKKISVEAPNGRLSNGGICNGALSPDLGELGEVGPSPPGIGQWSSPESVNPHIMRGMKGCIEWPRGVQKQSLKSKLLEARTESQKIQLRHALKQKI